jgi:hypothetical protein
MADTYMFEFSSEEIKGVSVYKSVEGYNYASVTIKRGQSYININYEWRDETTPDFVMDMIMFFGPAKVTASVDDEGTIEFLKRLKSLE